MPKLFQAFTLAYGGLAAVPSNGRLIAAKAEAENAVNSSGEGVKWFRLQTGGGAPHFGRPAALTTEQHI
jgi:hypothetical protein